MIKSIPDKSIDMVLSDLPFGITQNKWDNPISLPDLWKEFRRVCKSNAAIVLHCFQPYTTDLIMSNRKEFKYCWYWNKHLATGFLNAKKQPLRNMEEIAVFYRKQPEYHPQMRKGDYHEQCKMGETGSSNYGKQTRDGLSKISDLYYPTTLLNFSKDIFKKGIHPTSKPVELEKYLIKTYTSPGQNVLDVTMGGGSTGVACVEAQRNFIGFELDENYYEMAKNRIFEAQNS